jgi:hypothetical protein
MLTFWATSFPHRKPEHYVFPSEKVGLDGEAGYLKGAVTPYDINREKPMGSWMTAWNQARKTAAIILAGNPKNAEDIAPLACRFHDCRGCVATSGLLCGDVRESRNGNPTRDLQMAADRTRIHTLCGPVVSSLFSFAAGC